LEVYHLVNGFYEPLPANERGHYAIAPLGVELGLWEGCYQNQTQRWLRWWDAQGNLLLIGDERAQQEQQARRDAIPRLLDMGLSVEQVAEALGFEVQEVRAISQR